MIKRNIGKYIKKYRTEANLSQIKLGELLGVNHRTISSWETDRTEPDAESVERMAQIFKCKKSDLVGTNNTETESYYNDPESEKLAQFLFDNPNYKVLFDASKNVRPEDIQKVAAMIALMSNKQDN